MNKGQLFVVYFDVNRTINVAEINTTDYEKKVIWARLSSKADPRNPTVDQLPRLIQFAKQNAAVSAEVWSFWSELSIRKLRSIAKHYPTELIELIRQEGDAVYVGKTTVK